MSGMAEIEVDKRSDILPSAVFIDSKSAWAESRRSFSIRKIRSHSKKGMEEREHIMEGSLFEKREYREITMGIGGHEHIDVVIEEIAFPMGIPSPVAVWLGIMAFAVTGRTAFFFAVAGTLCPLCSSTDGSAVTGKSQMFRIDEFF